MEHLHYIVALSPNGARKENLQAIFHCMARDLQRSICAVDRWHYNANCNKYATGSSGG
jgi:hypothetical protein